MNDKIKELAVEKDILNQIQNSLFPTILGHDLAKKAIVLQLFGDSKTFGNIHVLLKGGLGTAKTEMIEEIRKIFPENPHLSLEKDYTESQQKIPVGRMQATKVRFECPTCGTLISITQDKIKLNEPSSCPCGRKENFKIISKEMIDILSEDNNQGEKKKSFLPKDQMKGARIIYIDNAEKITKEQKRELERIMEEEDGDVSILAISNNEEFDYLKTKQFTDEFLTKFDLIIEIRPDPQLDKKVASKILENSESKKETISPQLVKDYIEYAKSSVHPQLEGEAQRQLVNFYGRIRDEKDMRGAPRFNRRQIKTLAKMAIAYARIRLSDLVTEEDARKAIRTFREIYPLVEEETQPDKWEEILKRIGPVNRGTQ